MKYVLVIGDGMADEPLHELQSQTPLSVVTSDAFDRIAGSEIGLCRTIPQGVPPGSDTAIMNIFGYDPQVYYTGRSALEAAGLGIFIKPQQVSLRVNLCSVAESSSALILKSHNGSNIDGDQAYTLMNDLLKQPEFLTICQKMNFQFSLTRSFRHIGILDKVAEDIALPHFTEPHNIIDESITAYLPGIPGVFKYMSDMMLLSYRFLDKHPINRKRCEKGDMPANMLWPWGAARSVILPSFNEMYHVSGCVVSAVPLVWGIAGLCGLSVIKVPGATGDIHTNYEGKVDAVVNALQKGYDFAALHIEAPDEESHAGNIEGKVQAISLISDRIITPLLTRLPSLGDYRLLFMSDHATLIRTKTHDNSPIPYGLYDSRLDTGVRLKYNEKQAAKRGIIIDGNHILQHLLCTC